MDTPSVGRRFVHVPGGGFDVSFYFFRPVCVQKKYLSWLTGRWNALLFFSHPCLHNFLSESENVPLSFATQFITDYANKLKYDYKWKLFPFELFLNAKLDCKIQIAFNRCWVRNTSHLVSFIRAFVSSTFPQFLSGLNVLTFLAFRYYSFFFGLLFDPFVSQFVGPFLFRQWMLNLPG